MSSLSNSEITTQIERCKRRLAGHGLRYDLPLEKQGTTSKPAPRADRRERLLTRKAQLENELAERLAGAERARRLAAADAPKAQ